MLINLRTYPTEKVLDILLKDRTTGQNIIWATDAYQEHGFSGRKQITKTDLLGLDAVLLQPRIEKALEEQQARTRKKAEVFTPVWLCNQMNNYVDEEWFGRKNVFNTEFGHEWLTTNENIKFPEGKTWTQYVNSNRLEITCGEAPFLVSRYDAATGDLILPPKRRIGLLDRKLRIVNENTKEIKTWKTWATKAFQSIYGYEYQGDSLLIARINLLMTYVDYYEDRWEKKPDLKTLRNIAEIISWNIWQMDGLKDTVPLGRPAVETEQITLFNMDEAGADDVNEAQLCVIRDWKRKKDIVFKDLKKEGE